MHNKRSRDIFPQLIVIFVFLIMACFFAPALHAEQVVDDVWGYSLDLPEGYQIADQDAEGLSVLFTNDKIPVTVASKVYKAGVSPSIKSAEDALRDAMRKLPNRYFDISTVPYRRSTAAIACFDMTLDSDMSGWACAAPLALRGGQVVIIAYTPVTGSTGSADGPGGGTSSDKDIWQAVIISVLNSLATDTGSKREAGIMTRFAYPATGKKNVHLNIADTLIDTAIDESDAGAADFVVGTEYAVLTLYANDKQYKEAWKRYYKAIFRDALGRLEQASDDIYAAIRGKARESFSEGYYLSSALLVWAQSMPYARGNNAADFTSLPAAFSGEGCDCDTRSLLLCVLLESMGVRCALFVSPVYSHALFGADIPTRNPNENARLMCDGTEYLLGETTAHDVPLGMIAEAHSETPKWMGISLSE